MLSDLRTSLIGVAALLAGAGMLIYGTITWDQFLVFLGIFGLGVAAKDAGKSGK